MQFGHFNIHVIRESTLRLDGGAMFGVVPKTLWAKTSEVDGENRVLMSCNLLLIDTGSRKILVETGMGDRWTDKERERYDLRTIKAPDMVLGDLGLRAEQIDYVIISHLHFDHVGGAVRLVDGKLVPTYPNAKYIVQKGEWDFAFKANARAKASYRPDDFVPLMDHGQIQFVDGDSEIVPGVHVRITGGHTSHHQVVYFHSGDAKGVYFADILPTRAHLSPPWVMGYDHYPLASCDIKSEWLARAVKENLLVVFDHEHGIPWGHVSIGADKKFVFTALDVGTLALPCQSPVSSN
ncbi:MAG: fold metallo-hydrolase [Cyanobacteriota bacterium erpe_2018_sw_39hr_WHONDRS-SW48-000098_B_bin.30]|jgi:glyoxylase-like metal-dependent hydrolase (beta-lactamase superfamily II)|nr:fold metallo-hydrolase [Cyanobacteriota bacterium erpe_2018_sw_39hr_WHONDRS-SW48-000098_B_bin.30]